MVWFVLAIIISFVFWSAILVFCFAIAFLILNICFKGGRRELSDLWIDSLLQIDESWYFARVIFVLKKLIKCRLNRFQRTKLSGVIDLVFSDPSECIPRFTTIKTQTDRIILNWQAEKTTSLFTNHEYELQVHILLSTTWK